MLIHNLVCTFSFSIVKTHAILASELSRPLAMLPRVLTRVSSRMRSHPPCAYARFSVGPCSTFVPQRQDKCFISPVCQAAPYAVEAAPLRFSLSAPRRRFSAGTEAHVPPPDPELAAGQPPPGHEPTAGIGPETSPASTPAHLNCAAYYTARNIDARSVCKVRGHLQA